METCKSAAGRDFFPVLVHDIPGSRLFPLLPNRYNSHYQLLLALVAIFIIGLAGCNSSHNPDKTVLSQGIKTGKINRYLLIDTVVEKINYQVIYDSSQNALYFSYGNKSLKINSKGFRITTFDLHLLTLNGYSVNATILDSSGHFKSGEKMFFADKYIFFELTPDMMDYYLFIIPRDHGQIKNGFSLPFNDSKLVSFPNPNTSYMDNYYLDISQNLIVTEDRLSYFHEGPYLISIFKIAHDSIIKTGERLFDNYPVSKRKHRDRIFRNQYKLLDCAQMMLRDIKRK